MYSKEKSQIMSIHLAYVYSKDTSRNKSEAELVALTHATEIIIGRATQTEDANVHLRLNFDGRVSRKHARLYFDLSAWWVEDLNSRTGTFVNEERVIPLKPVQLQSHDRVRVGDTTILVRLEGLPKPIQDAIETSAIGSISLPSRSPSVITPTSIEFHAPKLTKSIVQNVIQNVHKTSRFAQGQNLLRAIIEELHTAFSIANHLTLIRLENEDRELVVREWYPNDDMGAKVSLTLARKAIQTRDTQVWQRGDLRHVTAIDTVHSVYVPVIYMGEVRGVLHMNANTIISADDIARFEQLALAFASFIDQPRGELEEVPMLFISYKSEEIDFVRQLEKDLRKRGICAWYDDRIRIGDRNWRDRLEKTIQEVDFFLIVLSQASVESEYVRWELQVAEDAHKPIFPVQIEVCKVPSTINRIQRAHMLMNPADNWEQYETELYKLSAAIWDKKKGISG
jgi:pSer/pThr/pTyr-binding forkhead associated (FHA) protein